MRVGGRVGEIVVLVAVRLVRFVGDLGALPLAVAVVAMCTTVAVSVVIVVVK